MQPKNIVIFDSVNAADGKWIDISNCVSLSVHTVNLEGKVWIELSNDPDIMTDGSTISAPNAPTLSQFTGPLNNAGNPTVVTPGAFSVKLTFVVPGGGETTIGSAASITVSSTNQLMVKAPSDPSGIAVAYNVYIQLGGSGSYFLQNGPGASNGGNLNYNGPIKLGNPFVLFAYIGSGVTPPSSNSASGPGLGVNGVPGQNLTSWVSNSPPYIDSPIAIFADSNNGNQAVWSPSSMTWKWLRVRKDNSAQTKETISYLMGQNG